MNKMYCNHCQEFIQYLQEHKNDCPERVHAITSTVADTIENHKEIADKELLLSQQNKITSLQSQLEKEQADSWKCIDRLEEYKDLLDKANEKTQKLKELLLLTDPVVSNVVVGDTQLKQWQEFIKCFPEEGVNE